MGEILFTEPILKERIWGGSRLAGEWGYDIPSDHTGECWAVSAHANGDCRIAGGRFDGRRLSELWSEEPALFGNAGGDRFPLLVKIIDAADDLSIQVHPDDGYAAVRENGSPGKTECWYVLDAPEGARLVIGHNAADKKELTDMIKNGRWNEFLRYLPVGKGDFIQIDPGTVHAITAGVEVLETQQNSDITYRVYDYDRSAGGRPRELHVGRSMDVIQVPAKSAEESVLRADKIDLMSQNNKMLLLIDCEKYRVWKLAVDGRAAFMQGEPFLIMSVIDGAGEINGTRIGKGAHFILPSGFGEAVLEGSMELIASSVGVPVSLRRDAQFPLE